MDTLYEDQYAFLIILVILQDMRNVQTKVYIKSNHTFNNQ
jgi:hypothetical protein